MKLPILIINAFRLLKATPSIGWGRGAGMSRTERSRATAQVVSWFWLLRRARSRAEREQSCPNDPWTSPDSGHWSFRTVD